MIFIDLWKANDMALGQLIWQMLKKKCISMMWREYAGCVRTVTSVNITCDEVLSWILLQKGAAFTPYLH